MDRVLLHLLMPLVMIPFASSTTEPPAKVVRDGKLPGLRNRIQFIATSCKDIKERYDQTEDGLYYLTPASGAVYLTFCDMTTAGGGWTLVASVHENNMYGKCTGGDRWSSTQGNDPNRPDGDGNWANRATFGTPDGATSDDFKNPGYYDIKAKDVSVWHVPNNTPLEHWNKDSILRYHTDRCFLTLYGGNLYQLFKRYPVRYNAGSFSNGGPSIPIVYDYGNRATTSALYGPYNRARFEAGYITFRVFNCEKAAMAICSGMKPKACHTEHFCIGGGGYFPEAAPKQCGDFTSFDGSGYGTNKVASNSREITEAAVLLFYR